MGLSRSFPPRLAFRVSGHGKDDSPNDIDPNRLRTACPERPPLETRTLSPRHAGTRAKVAGERYTNRSDAPSRLSRGAKPFRASRNRVHCGARRSFHSLVIFFRDFPIGISCFHARETGRDRARQVSKRLLRGSGRLEEDEAMADVTRWWITRVLAAVLACVLFPASGTLFRCRSHARKPVIFVGARRPSGERRCRVTFRYSAFKSPCLASG